VDWPFVGVASANNRLAANGTSLDIKSSCTQKRAMGAPAQMVPGRGPNSTLFFQDNRAAFVSDMFEWDDGRFLDSRWKLVIENNGTLGPDDPVTAMRRQE
jgi:hypothetical protein